MGRLPREFNVQSKLERADIIDEELSNPMTSLKLSNKWM